MDEIFGKHKRLSLGDHARSECEMPVQQLRMSFDAVQAAEFWSPIPCCVIRFVLQ
jgi:hypothetical protein